MNALDFQNACAASHIRADHHAVDFFQFDNLIVHQPIELWWLWCKIIMCAIWGWFFHYQNSSGYQLLRFFFKSCPTSSFEGIYREKWVQWQVEEMVLRRMEWRQAASSLIILVFLSTHHMLTFHCGHAGKQGQLCKITTHFFVLIIIDHSQGGISAG